MTWRRFGVLLRQLPDRSRLKVAASDGESEWGATEHLLAAVVDVLQVANWQRASSPKKKAPRPKPFPRPRDLADLRRHQKEKRRRVAEWRAKHGKG